MESMDVARHSVPVFYVFSVFIADFGRVFVHKGLMDC